MSTKLVDLLARYWKEGDESAFSQLWEESLSWLYPAVRRRMQGHHRRFEASADVVQETFKSLIAQGPKPELNTDASFKAYVCTIVANLLIDRNDYIFAAKRDPGLEVQAQSGTSWAGSLARSADRPSQVAQRDEDRNRLIAATLLLRAEDRVVIRLRNFDELAWAEIGETLGVSEDAARMRHKRAELRLGDALHALNDGDVSIVADAQESGA